MRRALLGAIVGGLAMFGAVFAIVMAVSPAGQDNFPAAAVLGSLLAGNGAIVGAVVGATGDIAAQLRRAFPNGHCPKRDYAEEVSSDHDPMPGLLTALRIAGLVVLIVALLVLVGKS